MPTTKHRDETTFQHIPAPFKRDSTTNKLIIPSFVSPELESTASLPWVFTEKIDGFNVKVEWDGYRVSFSGRKDDTQLPLPLYDFLRAQFGTEEKEDLFMEMFGLTNAVLYGEGFGPKFHDGSRYGSETSMLLFDVKKGDAFVERKELEEIADFFHIEAVPVILEGTIQDAIDLVHAGFTSEFGDFPAEGLVGITKAGLRARNGDRLSVNIKAKDFE